MACRWLAASAVGLVASAPLVAATAADVGGCAGTAPERIVPADSSNFESASRSLLPGDVMQLAPGSYSGGDLDVENLHGTPDRCIIIEGPAAGPPAVWLGSDLYNSISIQGSSYVVIRNLEVDGQGYSGDGVKLESGTTGHHITLENLYVHDHDGSQQTVCISTKGPAWNWVIRNSTLERCGTGMYLGNSDGEDEFVNSLVEHNLIVDAVGYDLQIKHQNGRNTGLGMPASGVTILRHNVLAKGANSSGGGDARPNLLVGHWPLTGPGSDDDYLIYGNFFYGNPTGVEALFQGEGNVIFYDNLLVNPDGPGATFQAQNDVPRRIRAFHNTVVAAGFGIHVSGADTGSYEQWIVGNAIFAGSQPGDPIAGGTTVADNTTATEAAATAFLNEPFGAPGVDLDLFPTAGSALQAAVDTTGLEGWEDALLDFNGTPRTVDYRGAYAGEGNNPGWAPALEPKPGAAIFSDGFESGDTAAWSLRVP